MIVSLLSKYQKTIFFSDTLPGVNLVFDKQLGPMKARCYTITLVNIDDNLRLKLDENYIACLLLLEHTKSCDKVDHIILETTV